MRIQVTIPGEPNAETLGIALEAATRLAQHDIASGDIPPIEDAIKSGIYWKEEPPGEESFDPPHVVLARGDGDCDDFAPWLAGEMRETGFDGGASAIAIPSGHNTWHAIVRGSDGEVYDPSVWAGMPYTISGGARGGTCACCKPLNAGKPALAIGRRGVRVDVPGLQRSRGCMIGVSHQASCEPTDESRVLTLIEAIEDAIATAQLARTGDKRAIKQLAVIYRVLHGEDLQTACNGLRLRPDQVGIDFDSSSVRTWIRKARDILASACDEAFAGDTWMANGGRIVRARKVAISGQAHRMGVIPCLAPLGPLAAAASTAGTLAAVVGPLALALQKMVGENTDVGRAMAELMKVTDKVKLVSVVSSGLTGLMEAGIPAAWTQGASRWAELLQSPLAAAGVGTSTPQVANSLHWIEKHAAGVMPPHLATKLAPPVLDLMAESQRALTLLKDGPKKAAEYVKKAFDLVKDETRAWIESMKNVEGFLPPNFSGDDIARLAEAKATQFFTQLIAAPPPPVVDYVDLPEDAYVPAPADGPIVDMPPSPYGLDPIAPPLSTPGHLAAVDFVAVNLTNELERENLRPPVDVDVPAGWDDVFALGCLQQTDFCT
jgi:hypothetical protein